MEPNSPARKNRSLVIIIVLLVILILLLVFFIFGRGEKEDDVPQIGYATEGVTVVEDPNALQAAVDEAFAKAAEGSMALEYKGVAISADGKEFSCYIANSLSNSYDMYLDLYADAELTERLFLSGLIRPGEAFESITLDKKLKPGSHTVYAVHTQVEEDLETIHAQVIVTVEFTVE